MVELAVAPASGYFDGPDLTTRMGVTYGAHLSGPFHGRALSVVLERDGKVVAKDDSVGLMMLQLSDSQAARIGEGSLDSDMLRTKGPHPDFIVHPAQPGRYALSIELRPDRGGPDVTVKVGDPFDVELAPGTADAPEPAITRDWYLGRAAIRLSDGPFYGEREVSRDASFWITLPTDLRLEKSRVDVLFYARGALQGRFTREVANAKTVTDRPLAVPLVVFGWPAELPISRVKATSGSWDIHVIQDGAYVTTCTFAVDNGRLAGPVSASRQLRCAPVTSGTVLDAKQVARAIQGHHPGGFRAKEVMALHRSKEVRAMRHKLEEEARAGAGLVGEERRAEAAKYEATNDREWTRASADQQMAHQLGRQARASLPALRKQYEALVEKYGR